MTSVRRNARNQALYRHVNENIRAAHDEHFPQSELDVFCECGAIGCRHMIRMSVADYERIRAEPTYFVVAPGHDTEVVERVVARTPAYAVVENYGFAAAIARETDPRAPAS
jgi:hypothetical protein